MNKPCTPNYQLQTGRLRLLQTTDLHMQLLDYDYFGDQQDNTIGLIGLADQITALRQDPMVTTLLCDNGDLIQGNPLADYVAQTLRAGQLHPMIAALNLLEYDVGTLGNHEFDYGLAFLKTVLEKAVFPIVCANIAFDEGTQIAAPYVILDRVIHCDDGVSRDIRIGVTGFAPPQFGDWQNSGDQNAAARAEDIITAAEHIVPQIRGNGADLVVALCHSGLGGTAYQPRMENAAIPLAQVEGIDAILMGHTHESFPDPLRAATDITDYAQGHIHGKPAVMAGFCGTSLGVIDLALQWASHRWKITSHDVRLIKPQSPATAKSAQCQKLRALVSAPHQATIAKMQESIAHTAVPIASYLATIQPDLSQQILAQAMQRAVSRALADSAYAKTPVLGAISSFRFGGRSGLGHYIDIPEGPITLRDAAAVFPFADALCAVRRTGAQLRLWLERSAAHYNQITQGQDDTPLIHPQSAGYNCDAIYGLSYQIDLTQPAAFDTQGQILESSARRIRALTYQGKPVSEDDVFIVAANSFRAKGGGGFTPIGADDVVYTSSHSLRNILIADLKSQGTVHAILEPTWSFAPISQTSAVFHSAPEAVQHLPRNISHIRTEPDGTACFRIHF